MFLDKLFRFVPQNPLGQALRSIHKGDFEAAALQLDELLAGEETHGEDLERYATEAWIEVGKRRWRNSDAPGAVEAFERVLALRPDYADVRCQLGEIHESRGQLDKARRQFERALQINPRYLEARLSLARVLMSIENPQGAFDQLQQAAASAPDSARHQLESTEVVEPDARDSAEALQEVAEKLRAASTSTTREGIERARHALQKGQSREAISELKRLLEMHPDFPDLHNLLGIAYDNENMVDDAIEEFEEALTHNAMFLDARLNLGLTLFGEGHHELAERHLRIVHKEKPDHRIVQSVLAQIEERIGANP